MPDLDTKKVLDREASRRYRERHPDHRRESCRRYREAHGEEARSRTAAYRAEHLDARRAYGRAYRAAHLDEVRTYARERMRRLREDPAMRQVLSDRATAYARRKRTGVDEALYTQLLVEQDGRCSVCGGEGDGKALHADHDHVTGRSRKLLCHRCNTGLGLFRDDPDVLLSALVYALTARAM